jgi:hypothetical protein
MYLFYRYLPNLRDGFERYLYLILRKIRNKKNLQIALTVFEYCSDSNVIFI